MTQIGWVLKSLTTGYISTNDIWTTKDLAERMLAHYKKRCPDVNFELKPVYVKD